MMKPDVYRQSPVPLDRVPGRYLDYPWVEPVTVASVVSRTVLHEKGGAAFAAEAVLEEVKAKCIADRRTILSDITVSVEDGHSRDVFTANRVVVMAEVITLDRYGRMTWPHFTPFPRLSAARWKIIDWRERTRRAWGELRG